MISICLLLRCDLPSWSCDPQSAHQLRRSALLHDTEPLVQLRLPIGLTATTANIEVCLYNIQPCIVGRLHLSEYWYKTTVDYSHWRIQNFIIKGERSMKGVWEGGIAPSQKKWIFTWNKWVLVHSRIFFTVTQKLVRSMGTAAPPPPPLWIRHCRLYRQEQNYSRIVYSFLPHDA